MLSGPLALCARQCFACIITAWSFIAQLLVIGRGHWKTSGGFPHRDVVLLYFFRVRYSKV